MKYRASESPAKKTEYNWETNTSKFTWEVDPSSSVAMYVQIEETIMAAIAKGRLSVSDRLPSVRGLSDGLEINPNTVAKSYRDLEVMGLLYTRRGVGVYVNEDAKRSAIDMCARKVRQRAEELVRFAGDSGTLVLVRQAVAKEAKL